MATVLSTRGVPERGVLTVTERKIADQALAAAQAASRLHSRASHASIEARRTTDGVTLTISDDGIDSILRLTFPVSDWRACASGCA